MKTYFKINISLLMLAILFIVAGCSGSSTDITDPTTTTTGSQSDGTLTVSATTSNAGGNYAPRNIVAIWVETESGTFVKSLMVYAQNYKQYLTYWKKSSTGNVTDAITGATKTSHGTRTCTWDGTDKSGNVVANGNYRVCMELTDKNATGNYHYFSFTKDSTAFSSSPSDVSSFSSISIKWNPAN